MPRQVKAIQPTKSRAKGHQSQVRPADTMGITTTRVQKAWGVHLSRKFGTRW